MGSNHSYEKNYNYLKNYKINYCVHNYFPIPKKSIVVNIASQNKVLRANGIQLADQLFDFIANKVSKISKTTVSNKGTGVISLEWPIANTDGKQKNKKHSTSDLALITCAYSDLINIRNNKLNKKKGE